MLERRDLPAAGTRHALDSWDAWEGLLLPLATPVPTGLPAPLRTRLLQRTTRSARAARAFVTVRHPSAVAAAADGATPGMQVHELYRRPAERAARRGEPTRVRLVHLPPSATWAVPACAERREWLLLDGTLHQGGHRLERLDYHLLPPGAGTAARAGEQGAWVYERVAPTLDVTPAALPAPPWRPFAPGIQRRLLWQQGDEAAMLYRADPGAAVPRHAHGHDEECLMIEGEVFLDDLLLQPLDYQLAPAGTGHEGVSTDTGALIFAHGDLDLDLLPAG